MRDGALMEAVSLGLALPCVSTSMESLPPPQIPLANERWCDEIYFQPLLFTPTRVTVPLGHGSLLQVPLNFAFHLNVDSFALTLTLDTVYMRWLYNLVLEFRVHPQGDSFYTSRRILSHTLPY